MENITPYRPFPIDFRGDEKNGAFCEIEDELLSKFIVIRATPYMRDAEREESLVSDGIMTWGDIYPHLEALGYTPSKEDTYWLYAVDVCDIDKEFLEESDSEIFALNAKNCELYYFDNFNKCMIFVKDKYNADTNNFKKLWETNYPQY